VPGGTERTFATAGGPPGQGKVNSGKGKSVGGNPFLSFSRGVGSEGGGNAATAEEDAYTEPTPMRWERGEKKRNSFGHVALVEGDFHLNTVQGEGKRGGPGCGKEF